MIEALSSQSSIFYLRLSTVVSIGKIYNTSLFVLRTFLYLQS